MFMLNHHCEACRQNGGSRRYVTSHRDLFQYIVNREIKYKYNAHDMLNIL